MKKFANLCPKSHLKAVLFRRYITFKRSFKSIIASIIGTLFLSCLGIAVYYMMDGLNSINKKPITFNSYTQDRKDFVIIGKEENELSNEIIQKLKDNFIKQTGIQPEFHKYDNISQMQNSLYDLQSHKKLKYLIPFGLDITKDPAKIIIFYNSTTNDEIENPNQLEIFAFVLIGQALWELQYDSIDTNENYFYLTKNIDSIKDNDIDFNFIKMNKIGLSVFFQALCPMFLVFGLLTIVVLVITTPINDIRGEVRTYMIQCTLKLFPYWFGAFIVDLCIWIMITTIVWGLFNLGWIKPFHDNLFSIWWILVFQGPSVLLFLYAFSFFFKYPESGPRQIFIILLIVNFAVVLITLTLSTRQIWLNWVWSSFPTISIQQAIYLIMEHTGLDKMSFSSYWKSKEINPFFIMQWVDIFIYGFILFIIEISRKSIERSRAKHSFSNYADYFKKMKEMSEKSPETIKMEDEVHNSHDWAVRIEDVSRLFINTARKPIPAVNCVCLGIKEGSCFGFLGANGAGKTTLMNMITGTLPPSFGSIEIFKTPIENIEDKTVISICPQFNTHLFNELTPNEHFKIYSWLFQKDPNEANELTRSLIFELELIDFQNIPICELSGGDVRKLAIALSFFGPSKLLLLDEPTAFLDPVACHCVQKMILQHKGEKTFMLCTHILTEAEMLCDFISIMVKGNIYTVGTPQYLTQKFGTEYKIDIMLEDASQQSAEKIDSFFNDKLPFARLTIVRPASRIYSVPASKIQLAELFEILENGQIEMNGYKYFTCSTSSLERVFMEIVRMSEQKDSQQNNDSDLYLDEKNNNMKKNIDSNDSNDNFP